MLDINGIEIKINDRVAIGPECDAFMMGYHYGKVLSIGRKYVTIEAERLSARRNFKFTPDHLSVQLMAAWLK